VAAAVPKLDGVDVIFTGVQLNEGQNAQKGAALAGLLRWPLVSYVEAVEEHKETGLTLRRAIEGGIQVVEVDCPVVISVGVALLKEDPRAPRSAKAKLKLKHKKTPITEWHTTDLESQETLPSPSVGIRAYAAQEQRSFPSSRVDGNDSGELRRMIDELRQGGLVR
jgi:electron transfer flavoprotein alpha/beta subunit